MTSSEVLGIDKNNVINDRTLADQAFRADDRKFADLRPAAKESKDRRENVPSSDLDLDHIDKNIISNRTHFAGDSAQWA